MTEPESGPSSDPARLAAMSDETLIGLAGRDAGQDQYAMEMQRRTNVVQAELTAVIRQFRDSTDRSARWMLIATVVLVVLTVLLAVLTMVLVIDPPSEPDL